MSRVSIINEGIKELDFLKSKLNERDAEVFVLKTLDQLCANDTNTLICHASSLKNYGDDPKNLLSLARNFKIKKVILIEGYGDTFKVKKELVILL